MDKSWIHQSRESDAYLEGVGRFLDFAFDKAAQRGLILCPCRKCNNCYWKNREDVYEHLTCDGFMRNYSHWIFHGETFLTSTSANAPHSDSPPLTYSTMSNKKSPRCLVGPMARIVCLQQKDQSGPNQPQSQQIQQSSPAYSQPLYPHDEPSLAQLSCIQPYETQLPQGSFSEPHQTQSQQSSSSQPPQTHSPQQSSSQLHQTQVRSSYLDQSLPAPPPPSSGQSDLAQPMQLSFNKLEQIQSDQPSFSQLNQMQLAQLKSGQPGQMQLLQPSSSQPDQMQLTQLSSSLLDQKHLAEPSSKEPQASRPWIGDDTGSARKRRGRGPTRCLDVWNSPEGQHIRVAFNNLGQPIGRKAAKLSNFLGTIARDGHLAPLNFIDWRAVPDGSKEKMWQLVESKFDIDPIGKDWVLKSLGTKWRNWKAELKAAHYDTHKTDEERLADCDKRVVPDQWPFLVAYWSSKKGKARSNTNRANRVHLRFGHTSGTKSFARIREEERVKRPDGQELSRAELFVLTHTHKDGQPMDEASLEAIVMGEEKPGRLRTYGLGPSPSDIYGPRPTRSEAMKMVSEAKKAADEEVRMMKEKMNAMEQKYTEMQTQMTMMITRMEAMHKRFLDEQLSDNTGAPSEPLGSRQAPDTSSAQEALQQSQAHSLLAGHADPSDEGRAAKRGKAHRVLRTR
uniref:Uncharacterized protein LOC105043294 isoform X2 n=1 Tax=Elaeis guineensis var. tenera TaxID=51953 RepID=A0A8N4F3M5_ELAGV|nr:uncharacterized protein LOC105043294 isoform X2 [Elaeis guineensis]